MKVSPWHFLHTFYQAPCISHEQISGSCLASKYSFSHEHPCTGGDRASDGRLGVRFRGRSQCNCGGGIRGAATCTAPTCTTARVCIRVCLYSYPHSGIPARRLYTCAFSRASVCLTRGKRSAGVRGGAGKRRGRRRAPQMRPQFHRGKTWRYPFTIAPEVVRASIRNADRPRRRRADVEAPPPRRAKYWKHNEELEKKNSRKSRQRGGRVDSDPRRNILRITSARFVGEILITFPRHRGGKVCV